MPELYRINRLYVSGLISKAERIELLATLPTKADTSWVDATQ